MVRTQIYLSQSQWRLLSALSRQRGETLSALIRQALDRTYGGVVQPDFETALRDMAGLWKGRADLPATHSDARPAKATCLAGG